ncbi:MAG: zinc ribbon domain-containing protein [Verrucomicrobiales bacterium]|nr:zinc ribbon domain-containing protein [Verrucomicrobiales bacterium]
MPTYEYHCQKCDAQFEVQQPMSAAPLSLCPREICARKPWGRGRVKRGVGGGAGLIFKGSGFYITDYRSEGYKSAAKSDSDSGKTKTESKAPESKPASGADAKKSSK